MTTEIARPRILLITRNLPPLVGGMERLNWHMADELSRHANVWIVGPEGAAQHGPAQIRVTEAPLRPLWRFLLASAFKALRIARKWRPDIVLAGSGLTAPAALLAAHATGARSIVYLHGLDAAVQHPIYRAIWNPAIRRMDTVLANSSATSELASTLGVTTPRLHVLHPGVQMPAAPQSIKALQRFRQRHELGEGLLLLSIGRLTTRKGLREFVQYALPSIVSNHPDVILIVVGEAPADSLQADVQTRDSIQATADAAGVGQHLRFLGVITDQAQLACAYESAALHVFPVRSLPADPEGFGMVAVEAAAHGLPTIAFATGGIIDAISEGISGHLIPQGDYHAFADSVIQSIRAPRIKREICISFAQRFSWEAFGERISSLLSLAPPQRTDG